MTRRFVVQEHTVRPGEVHYDLMIEDGAALVTFQLETAPGSRTDASGRRSFDHRPRYLDYEGPISGDRGDVRIWDRGQVEDLAGGPREARYRGQFEGDRLRGEFAIVEGEGGALRVAPAVP